MTKLVHIQYISTLNHFLLISSLYSHETHNVLFFHGCVRNVSFSYISSSFNCKPCILSFSASRTNSEKAVCVRIENVRSAHLHRTGLQRRIELKRVNVLANISKVARKRCVQMFYTEWRPLHWVRPYAFTSQRYGEYDKK